MEALTNITRAEREKEWKQKLAIEKGKFEKLNEAFAARIDSTEHEIATNTNAIERAFAEKLNAEKLRRIEENKASDAMLLQAKLELERAQAERIALEKATAARTKFAAAEAKWEREAEILQALRKQERTLEEKMESRIRREKASWQALRQKEKSEEASKVEKSEARLKLAMAEIDDARKEMESTKSAILKEKSTFLKREGELLERLSRANAERFTSAAGTQENVQKVKRRHSVNGDTPQNVSEHRMTPEQVLAIKLGPAPNPSNKPAYNLYIRRLERRQRAEDEIKARREGGTASSGASKKRIPLRERIAMARAERKSMAKMEEAAKVAAAARQAVEAKTKALEEKRKAASRHEKMERQRKKAVSKREPIEKAKVQTFKDFESKLETDIREQKTAENPEDSASTTPAADSILSPLTARRPPADEPISPNNNRPVVKPEKILQNGKKVKNKIKKKKMMLEVTTTTQKKVKFARDSKNKSKKGTSRPVSRRQAQKRKLAAMHKRMNRLSVRRIDPSRLRTASVRVQRWWRRSLFGLHLRKQMTARRVASTDIQRIFRGAKGRYAGRQYMNRTREERKRLARIAEFEAEERRKEELEAKEAEKRREAVTQRHKERLERRKRRQQVRRMKGKVMDKIRRQVEDAVNIHRSQRDLEDESTWKEQERQEILRRQRQQHEYSTPPGAMPLNDDEIGMKEDASNLSKQKGTNRSEQSLSASKMMLEVVLPTTKNNSSSSSGTFLDKSGKLQTLQHEQQRKKKNKISTSQHRLPSGPRPSNAVIEYRRGMNVQKTDDGQHKHKDIDTSPNEDLHIISSATDESSYLSIDIDSGSDTTKNKRLQNTTRRGKKNTSSSGRQQTMSSLTSIGATSELINVNSRAMAAVQRGAVDTARIILIRAQELLGQDDATTTNIAASLRATTLNNLGTVCSKQGKHEESLGFALAAVAAAQQIPSGPPGKDGLPNLASDEAQERARCLALALHNLGVQQECLGDAKAAKETFRRSKFIVQKALDAARANESDGYAGSSITKNTLRGADVELASVSSRSGMQNRNAEATKAAAQQIQQFSVRSETVTERSKMNMNLRDRGVVIQPATVRARIPTYGGSVGNSGMRSRRPHRVALLPDKLSQVEHRVHNQVVSGSHRTGDRFGRGQLGNRSAASFEELSNDVTRSTRAMDTWHMDEDDI
eukprot:g4797.t1